MDLNNKKFIYSVVIPIPSKGISSFDYLYDETEELPIGQVVKVPFGSKKNLWGVINKIRSAIPEMKLKFIIDVNHNFLLSQEMLDFIDWVSEWTMSGKGNILKLVFSTTDIFENKNIKFGWVIFPETNEKELKNKYPKFKLTEKRKNILQNLDELTPKITEKLLFESGASRQTLIELEKKQIIYRKNIIEKKQMLTFEKMNKRNIVLNSSQLKAAATIENIISKRNYAPILLDGVTGSGKTEVYFQAILNILKQKKQVLVLLPEIYLSTEWNFRFKQNFGFDPLIWHSNLSKKIRKETWFKVNRGDNNAIVGARSALFLPFSNLGLIIIDEEHDNSFKQEEGVLYNARDMALIRAKIEKIPIILSTATPSMETWSNSQNNKFSYVKLSERIGIAKMPEIQIVDMREANLDYNKWISHSLKDKISENLVNKNLSLLFLNRRGYAPLKLCNSCGHRLGCQNCESWLVEHKKDNILICHQCGITQKFENKCKSCGEEETLISCGPGVERIEEEIMGYFPEVKIEILSSDTVKNPQAMSTFLEKIQNSEIDIIIGTQMISKGHNFKNLTLVGIIDADMSLSGGDLRASEKAFQVLHQVSGRAGRENKKGIVLIQTYDPENQVIEALKKNNRDNFLTMEKDFRKVANLPPFGRLVSIIISSKDQYKLERFGNTLKDIAPNFENVSILGPAPATVFYLRGKFRYRFLIKTKKEINIQKVIKIWLQNTKIPSAIKLVIDIEPYSFL